MASIDTLEREEYNGCMYVDKLEIDNFRCFEHTEFRLVHPDRTDWGEAGEPALKNVNLFLGDNGSGKSSVFKAVAIGVLGQLVGTQTEYLVRRSSAREDPEIEAARLRTTMKPHKLDPYTTHDFEVFDSQFSGINWPGPDGVEISLSDDDIFRPLTEIPWDRRSKDTSYRRSLTQIDLVNHSVWVTRVEDVDHIETRTADRAYWNSINQHSSSSYFLVGYGVGRRSERPEGYSEAVRLPRYQRVAGLFEDHVGLAPFTYAYLQIKENGYLDEALELLNRLLPNSVRITDRTDAQNRPVFSVANVDLPFNVLSDGFRTYVGWLWDLMFQISVVQSQDPIASHRSLIDLEGVCIVDEIDLLLHPEWQRLVVKQVAEAFPKIQFLFSTHSPIVAGTLHAANIFVLDDNKVEQYPENIYGLTPNQILTSSYFGLSSTRAPGTGTLSDQARRNLGIDESDPDPMAAVAVRERINQLIAQGVISSTTAKARPKTTRRKPTPE